MKCKPITILLACCCLLLLFPLSAAAQKNSISGTIADEEGPVAGAIVRLQGTATVPATDKAGRFTLTGLPAGKKVNISVWKEGYYSLLAPDMVAPEKNLRLKLIRYSTKDNRRYKWISPVEKEGCIKCHDPAIMAMSLNDPHMKSAKNSRYLTMYNGTDTKGNQSPPTRYGPGIGVWNNSHIPHKPDKALPYYGPGSLLDFPGTAGDCSSCHNPGAALPYNVNPNMVQGADVYGIHCDFCHKIANVKLNPRTQMPHVGAPGVRSLDIRRPFTDDKERPQLFCGTFDDVNAAEGDTNLPLLKESRYCAACHYAVFWDTVIYNSYGEWLQSPYSNPKSGKAKTCQECHMPSPTVYKGRTITNVAPGKGGIERHPSAIHSHDMTVDENLLRNSLTMTAGAKKRNGLIEVEVTLFNDKTGHHIPSDSPLRHLILIVEATDAGGAALPLAKGSLLPEWCGKGNPQKGYYAGLPGKTYAKLLKERWTEVFPTGAYWNHTDLVSDNRLAALQSDTSTYSFAAPLSDKVVISVKLLYRRAFIKLMDQKKWNVPDILMAEKIMIVKN